MALEIDPKQIRSFSPINSLNPENAQDLIKKISATGVQAGQYVFKKGDADKTHTYLLSGAIELIDDKKVVKLIKAGSPEGMQPLAHAFPRRVSARAKIGSVVTRINSDMLDIMLTWDQTGSYTVEGVDEEDDETDWMTRILQTRAFHRIPPANIQAMFMRMESVSYKPGAKVIEQEEEGDYFYIIKETICKCIYHKYLVLYTHGHILSLL
jgi:CRP-like cAMP-binding protein